MNRAELYLKTIFCCMACDGDIATEEIDMVKRLSKENDTFTNIDAEKLINNWIEAINKEGLNFLKVYLKELSTTELSTTEQLYLIDLAIKTIEADNRIEYSEVKFFKKIRNTLSVSDEEILAQHPNKEDFILPDINVPELPTLENITFSQISLN